MRTLSLCLAAAGVFSIPLSAAVVASPNKRISVTVETKELLEPYPSGRRLYYSISFDGKPLILDSPFRLDFKGAAPIAQGLRITTEKRRTIDEKWEAVWGTRKEIRNNTNELTLIVDETAAPRRRMLFVVRAYDDGVAFRYEFPTQTGMKDFKLAAERTEFHFSGNPTVWAANYGSFVSHQEAEFKKMPLAQIRPGDIIGCPLLVNAGPAWVALTEADLTDWAGMYFTGSTTAPNAVMTLLSPRPDEPGVAVVSAAPRHSPWRTVMIAEQAGKLMESSLIPNLNEPVALTDTSWIKPGIAAWDIWWPGNYAPDYPGKLAMNTSSMKYFIDFAAEMGWKYQLVDWKWYGEPFDPAKPFGMAGHPNADLSRTIPEVDMPEIVRYAKSKNVSTLIWLEWSNAEKQMEKVFPLYEKWGIAGVKVDFMQRDDQWMVNMYDRMVKLAAEHHLTVDFHGAYKPTGRERTYPNLLTREGVLGNEFNKWSDRVTPEHNVTLPYTRMLVGPADFTPGGFRNKTPKTFRAVGSDEPGPFVMGTRAHQLAMLVVYFSPLQVMCDSPYSYRMSPGGLDFLKVVPTTWDETRFLAGEPGEYVVVARRSGKEWFIGGMNGNAGRTVTIPLDFLAEGDHWVRVWTDPDEAADYPDRVRSDQRTMKPGEQLKLSMAPGGGGFVAHIK